MATISVFNFITLNGFYKGKKEDISWHKQRSGAEEDKYASKGLKSESILLFGRLTYDMMSGYWPSPQALKNTPDMAKGMNKAQKIVFSKTLKKAEWNNTRIISGNIGDEVKKLKKTSDKNMTILGSGSIVTQLAELNLIDNFQFMVDPLAIGEGTSIFKGLKKQLDLKLTDVNQFKSGVVILHYKPAKK